MMSQRWNGLPGMWNASAWFEQETVSARVLRHHHHAFIHDHAEVKQA